VKRHSIKTNKMPELSGEQAERERERERERDFSSVYNEEAFNQDVSMKRHSIKTIKMPELSGEQAVFAINRRIQSRCFNEDARN